MSTTIFFAFSAKVFIFPPVSCVFNLHPRTIIKSEFWTAKFPNLVAATPNVPAFFSSESENKSTTAQVGA